MKAAPNPTSGERFSCLVVDDDAGLAGMFAKVISEEGGSPTVCHTLATAQGQLARQAFDLVLLDNKLPDGTGYEFYAHVVRHTPGSLVVMITGAPELSQAVELTRNGLFDYLTKPVSAEAFAALLRRVRLRLGHPEVSRQPAALLGGSAAMQQVVQQLEQAARHLQATVLLLGETGTGKDLAARLLHQLSYGPRAASAPYVAVNCPNIPAEMFEAELFGSEKGAYTGADRRRTGLVEAAEGGTLFLDEVAEIPSGLQAKLLRFLESREYRPLGGTTTQCFSGRVVAATNRILEAEVRAGRFREDLMYRLDVLSTRLPPLREHLADVDGIAEALLDQLCEKYQRLRLRLRPADLEALRRHTFPGNVRELRNLLERSLLRSEPQAAELVLDLAWLKGHAGPAMPGPGVLTSQPAPAVNRGLSTIEQQEYNLIAQALQEEDGAIRRAAARLGLTHQALLRRLQKWPELRQVGAAAASEPNPPPVG